MTQNTPPIKTASSVNSVGRALDILEYLTYAPEPVGISEISRHFSINRTTTYNLVTSLIEKGYVSKTDGGKYCVTSRMFELGTVFQNSFPLVHLVKRSVFPSRANIKYTCKLTILADNLRAVILFSRCTEDKMFQLPLGYSFPLHTSASGKVLLAYASPAVVEHYIETATFKRYTEYTITDKEQYRKELQKVRENGYAVDNCEFESDQVCYAAPVLNNTGAIAAISVSGGAAQMTEHRELLIQDILSYTRSLSLESGYTPNRLE